MCTLMQGVGLPMLVLTADFIIVRVRAEAPSESRVTCVAGRGPAAAHWHGVVSVGPVRDRVQFLGAEQELTRLGPARAARRGWAPGPGMTGPPPAGFKLPRRRVLSLNGMISCLSLGSAGNRSVPQATGESVAIRRRISPEDAAVRPVTVPSDDEAALIIAFS